MQQAQDDGCLAFDAANQEVARRLYDCRLATCVTQVVENNTRSEFGAGRSTSSDPRRNGV